VQFFVRACIQAYGFGLFVFGLQLVSAIDDSERQIRAPDYGPADLGYGSLQLPLRVLPFS
jgi:hypothetical protein